MVPLFRRFILAPFLFLQLRNMPKVCILGTGYDCKCSREGGCRRGYTRDGNEVTGPGGKRKTLPKTNITALIPKVCLPRTPTCRADPKVIIMKAV